MQKYFSVLLLFSFSTASLAAGAPVKTDVSAGYTYDDNVTRAEFDNDIETDSILNVEAGATYNIPFNDKSYFSIKGTLEANKYLDFSKLSNTRFGLHGSYHLRPFGGYTAMRYLARISYERCMYDSELRDGSATYFQLGLSKRLTDLLAIRAGYIKEKIDADSIVFDADNNRFYADADYRLNKKNTLYATLGYLDGDLVTTARSGIGITYKYWVVDDAFTDLSPLRWAYKLQGTATTIRLGDNFVIDSKQALDGSVLYYDSESDEGSTYSGFIYNLNYLYRF